MFIFLENCKKCKCHREIKESYVLCGRVKNFSVVIPIVPSNHNNGFKNGDLVVDCQLED